MLFQSLDCCTAFTAPSASALRELRRCAPHGSLPPCGGGNAVAQICPTAGTICVDARRCVHALVLAETNGGDSITSAAFALHMDSSFPAASTGSACREARRPRAGH